MRLIHFIKIVPNMDGGHAIHLNAIDAGSGDLTKSNVDDFKDAMAKAHRVLPEQIIICNVMQMKEE